MRELGKELGTDIQQTHGQQLDGLVSSLIDPSLRWWDLTKLRTLFNPKIIEAILKLPPSHSGEQDFWMWEHEKSGLYSVSSAYRFFRTCLTPDRGNASDAGEKKKFWDTLWRLKLPQKVKIFAWRACQEGLPSKQNLIRRRIPTTSQCCFCDTQVEDLRHALLYCPPIKQALASRFSVFQNKDYQGGFMQAAIDIMTKNSTNALSDFLLFTWAFWFRRNKMIHEQLNLPIQQVIATALAMKHVTKTGAPLQLAPGVLPHKHRWSAPPENAFKLNTDGALFFDLNKAGLGIILRDHNGDIVLAGSGSETSILEPEHVEAAALLRGLQLCLNLGISHLMVESDCLFLVDEINKPVLTSASIRSLVLEIKELMQRFPRCSIHHYSRLGNQAAHCLARHAWSLDDMILWWHSVPSFIENVTFIDKHYCTLS